MNYNREKSEQDSIKIIGATVGIGIFLAMCYGMFSLIIKLF